MARLLQKNSKRNVQSVRLLAKRLSPCIREVTADAVL